MTVNAFIRSVITACCIIKATMTAKNKHITQELSWGRIAAKTVYFMLGVGSGTFAANIPRIKDSLELSASELGLALLFFSVGGLIALQFAAPLIKRLGLRMLLSALAPTFPLVLIAIALADSFVALVLSFTLYGALTTIAGIAVNAQAIDIEKAYARSLMSSFHAMFSVGGMLGAALGGFLAAQHVTTFYSMTSVGISLAVLGVFVIAKLLDSEKYNSRVDHIVVQRPHEQHKMLWWRQVLLVGALIFACYLTEGAMADWTAIYMKETHMAGPFIAVFAYVIFTAAMTIGRFLGDGIIQRFGSLETLIGGGMLAALGLSIGLLSPNLVIAIIGFGFAGLGISVLVPILISMAGNIPGGDRDVAIARASTFGSIGLMSGPAIIGFVADGYSLLLALMVPVLLLCGLTVTALLMRKSARTTYHTSEVFD